MSAIVNTSHEVALTQGAQTLRRGLSVLRLLTRVGASGLKVGEISRRLELNRITALRLTKTLAEEGFVSHDDKSGVYRLGPEAFAVGLAAEPGYELQRLAAQTLQTLALETGDTVFFTVLHGSETICLSRNEGGFPVRNQLVKPGDRWPLGVGAGSCALLAAHSNADIFAILERSRSFRSKRYPRCTDEAIDKLVHETREKGYCVQPGLVDQNQWAVGVVVVDAAGLPVGSISVAAIASRLPFARSVALGNRLLQLSSQLTALLVSGENPRV